MRGSSRKILDTAVDGETGATKTVSTNEQFRGRRAHVQVQIGSGDEVVIEARLDDSLDWMTIATYAEDTLESIDLPGEYRARRSVDGAAGDSVVWVQVF